MQTDYSGPFQNALAFLAQSLQQRQAMERQGRMDSRQALMDQQNSRQNALAERLTLARLSEMQQAQAMEGQRRQAFSREFSASPVGPYAGDYATADNPRMPSLANVQNALFGMGDFEGGAEVAGMMPKPEKPDYREHAGVLGQLMGGQFTPVPGAPVKAEKNLPATWQEGDFEISGYYPEGRPQERKELSRGKKWSPNAANGSGKPTKPMPPAALKMQQEEVDALATAKNIQADMGAIRGQIEGGKLDLGLFSNWVNRGRNVAGMSTEQSRNFDTFRASLEKMRNDSLRLNKGVQTEGDAQRAWNELIANINDPRLVTERLQEIEAINSRAADLRRMNIDNIRGNYGLESLDTVAQENPQPAIGRGASGGWDTPETGPRPGTVEGGYRFIGGDPANPKSWKKVN